MSNPFKPGDVVHWYTDEHEQGLIIEVRGDRCVVHWYNHGKLFYPYTSLRYVKRPCTTKIQITI